MIEMSNITIKFKRTIINDGKIIISPKKITVITGESGSGKTSLLMELCLLSRNANKNMVINNKDIKSLKESERYSFIRNSIAVVPQNPCFLENMSIIENVEFICSLNQKNVDNEKLDKLCKFLNLDITYNTKVNELSGGEKQRLSIVCAILKDTPIIVMDEPTAYIDKGNINKIVLLLEILRDSYKKTIVVATHNKDIIDISNVHYHINNNQIECLTKNNKENSNINYYIKKIDLKDLNLFLKHYIKINKSKMRKILLSLFLIVGSIILLYTKNHLYLLNNQIKALESNQVLVDTYKDVTPKIVNQINNIKGIDYTTIYSYLITDNNYLISPYVSEDYFKHNITYKNDNNSKIYANYAVYRENKQDINLIINNQDIKLKINYYFDPLFKDYTIGSDIAKVIYIPLDSYNKLVSNNKINKIDTSCVLVKLQEEADYKEIVNKICDLDNQYSIFNKDKIDDIENINRIFGDYMIYISKFIMFLLLGTIIVLKVIRMYKWRKQLVLLEINGVPYKLLNHLNIKKK